jgi:hypothetical protein
MHGDTIVKGPIQKISCSAMQHNRECNTYEEQLRARFVVSTIEVSLEHIEF